MKKTIMAAAAIVLLSLTSNAQTLYKTALGLGIDFGGGSTLYGPQVKHVFGKNAALQGQLMFSDYDWMYVGLDYQYNKTFQGSRAVGWYLGIGPQLWFPTNGNNWTDFVLRPQAGLELKVPEVPIGVHFDWKPWWRLNHNTDFVAGHFTLGIKYLFK